MNHAQKAHDARYLDKYLEIVKQSGFGSKEKIRHQLLEKIREKIKEEVKWILEEGLKLELEEALGVKPYERMAQNRRPEQTRGGYWGREVRTSFAIVDRVRVPKLRCGNKQREWRVLERYERHWKEFLDAQILNYTLGHSVRDLVEALNRTLGQILSASTMNRMLLSLQVRAETFRSRKLEKPPKVILVDGLWVWIAYATGQLYTDKAGRVRAEFTLKKRVILTALGLWAEGSYEIIHWSIAEQEDTPSWESFFAELYEKGVTETTTQLVVSDGNEGIANGIALCLPGVKHQRCVFHKIKNILDNLSYGNLILDPNIEDKKAAEKKARRQREEQILKEAGEIYQVYDLAEIVKRAKQFKQTWEKIEPHAVKNFFTDFDKTINFLKVSFEHKSLITTTDLLERFFGGVRRRAQEILYFRSEESFNLFFYLISIREQAKQQALSQVYGFREKFGT